MPRFPTCLAWLTAASLFLGTSARGQGGPYVGGKFVGRIAYSADGNHNDPDDWAASPVALAIMAEAGVKERLVHFDYNCILPETNPEWEKTHAESVLGAVKGYGFDTSKFFDCRKNLDGATANLAAAIDASSAANPLYFIVAGPMEAPYLAIRKSDPSKRQFVFCISHSRWNDGFASRYTFTHTKRSVIDLGIHWVQIRDQNRLLSTSPYGKAASAENWQPWHWMRDAGDASVKFLWERMQVSTRPDPSDAGMAYFLVTGDEEADPQKLKRLLADHQRPPPVGERKQVRLEAENFRELMGFELEDRNDRNASHRLSVKASSGGGRIATRFAEPFAAPRGRYDVEVRYADAVSEPSQLTLSVNGKTVGSGWKSSGEIQTWASHTASDIEISTGDEIAVEAKGGGSRIDFVQFNRR